MGTRLTPAFSAAVFSEDSPFRARHPIAVEKQSAKETDPAFAEDEDFPNKESFGFTV
jgi:hypothetical protein